MNFWDEKREKLVKKCLGCSSAFIPDKGANCLDTCSDKKLEDEHKETVEKMIAFCLKHSKRVIVKFPNTFLKKKKEIKWGWAYDIKQIINIPWYTLRSKREFFDTIAHELAHITAYRKLFNLTKRSILRKTAFLEEKEKEFLKAYNFKEYFKISQKIKRIAEENKELFNRYIKWEGHDYDIWYEEYLRLHKKLLNPPFKKYAYGNFEPVPYELIVKSEKYKSN